MKSATKKKLMVLVIVLLFTMSSAAFVVTGLTGGASGQEFKPLDGFVHGKEPDAYTESVYIQNGFTFLKYYYKSSAPDYLDSLPYSFPANNGQPQIFVVKIKGEEDFASVSNANGVQEIREPDQKKITEALCSSLLATPVECSLMLLQNATA